MTATSFSIDRRILLGGLGTVLLLPSAPMWAQTRPVLALEAVAGTMALIPGQPPTPIWQLAGSPDSGPLRFKRGETVDITLTNRLPIPVALNWGGLDDSPAAEPMTGRPAVAPNASAMYTVIFRHAGTMLVELRPLGDAQAQPATARAVIVSETETVSVDRDEVLLFQDWRSKAESNAAAQTGNPGNLAEVFTVNGTASIDVTIGQHQRLRLRLINSSQTTVIAIKISDYDVRILAIDGQPSEPFLARDGLVVLAPGSRVDAFVDVAKAPGSISAILLLDGREGRPIGRLIVSDAKPARIAPLPIAAALPSNGLPSQLNLKSALRVDLALNSPGTTDWLAPATLTAKTPPAFKAKRGRTVVLALTNQGAKPATFHLHGHHFRLLDRLDDGWKPFWLDTLAIAAGQTQRIAFAAEFPGLYPIEAIATDWGSPRKVRSYLVE